VNRPLFVLRGLRVHKIEGDELQANALDVDKGQYWASCVLIKRIGLAGTRVLEVVMISLQCLCILERCWCENLPNPKRCGRQATQRETSDDAKVVRTALQYSPQLRMQRGRNRHNASIGEYNLVAHGIRADEAKPRRVERYSAFDSALLVVVTLFKTRPQII
jgi:hypothetical protein